MARIYQARTVRSILRDHDRQLKVQGSASVLARSGLSATAEDEVTMYGDFIVTGNFTAQGKISNDALTNPVKGDVTRAVTTGFALSTSMTTLTSTTWSVPAGFNQVSVSVIAKVFAYNSTAGLDYLQAMARVSVPTIGDIDGGATGTAASGSNGSGTSIGLGVAVFSNLAPTDQVIVAVRGQSSFGAWAANAGNYAEVSGTLTWYRV